MSCFFVFGAKILPPRESYKSFSVLLQNFFAEWEKLRIFAAMKQKELKREVERVLGHEVKNARDFEQLSDLLLSHTRERLSPTTLKRLWGYLKNENVQTRPHTYDVLARFVGYRNYEDFSAHAEGMDEVQSGVKAEQKITTEWLRRGQRLIITWRPNRKIVVRHQGNSLFEIMEAKNTKLSVGDTFRCHLMIQHEPLYLDEVVHQGQPAVVYVAGQRDGVIIEVCD